MSQIFQSLFTVDGIVALLALTIMEVLLGIDNVIFVSIILGKLNNESEKKKASMIWMIAGICSRIILLTSLATIISYTGNLFYLFGHPVTLKDIITVGGGLFLLINTTLEIHNKLEGEDPNVTIKENKNKSFKSIVMQIIIIDLVFSFDGVITALGMVKENAVLNSETVFFIRCVSILIAMFIMFKFSPKISAFIHMHPTFKMLALSFLILIAVMLIVDGINVEKIHLPHGYIYFAMAFSFGVEILNLQIRKKTNPVKLREPKLEEEKSA